MHSWAVDAHSLAGCEPCMRPRAMPLLPARQRAHVMPAVQVLTSPASSLPLLRDTLCYRPRCLLTPSSAHCLSRNAVRVLPRSSAIPPCARSSTDIAQRSCTPVCPCPAYPLPRHAMPCMALSCLPSSPSAPRPPSPDLPTSASSPAYCCCNSPVLCLLCYMRTPSVDVYQRVHTSLR